ncbi:MAG: adenosylcobinamide-phosphate synthase CbiB [Paenibacillaceae bacterium]
MNWESLSSIGFSDVIPHFVWVVALAILIDLWIGDPRWLPHPVVGMGKLISFLEQRWNKGSQRKRKGVVMAVFVIGTVYTSTFVTIWAAHQLNVYAGIGLEIYLLSTTISVKGLKDAALQVAAPLKTGNLVEARRQLGMIVGRDTEALNEPEIIRGTVETVAENTVDGITSPLFWMLVGGVPAAMAYRAVNTLDSMVGYKNERFLLFGRASARIDDAANWLPARLTALSMWIAAWFMPGLSVRTAMRITLLDAPKHPSPNSGWPESMTAGLLGIELGGRNSYQGVISERARMGRPTRELQCSDIRYSITIMHGGWLVFIAITGVITWFIQNHFI